MSRPARALPEARQGSLLSIVFFLAGVPLGLSILMMIKSGPLQNEELQRYTSHHAEQVALISFCCAICGLAGKLVQFSRERAAFLRTILPSWDGKPVVAGESKKLIEGLAKISMFTRNTYLGRRVANALSFVDSRGTANDLDDQLRCLSDNDAIALDSSYSLLRFITWAIPILGFLGTVLGITTSISNINPDTLEQSLSGVTGGLSEAFDSTAMALSLTMILMFFTSMMEKLDHGILDRVDRFVDAELTHRFLHTRELGGSSQQQTQTLLDVGQQLVEQQATLWMGSIQKAEKFWSESGNQQQQVISQAMQTAFEYALTRYGQRLAEMEDHLLTRNQALLDSMNLLSNSMKETGRENQLALARLTDALGLQLESVSKLHANEEQLNRLQQSLAQNLDLLQSNGTFDEAVQSLTAAIHLLTTRVNPQPAGANLRLAPRPEAA